MPPEIPPHIRASLPADLSTAPTVAPKEGWYGMMRNGEVVGPFRWEQRRHYPWAGSAERWTEDGAWSVSLTASPFDIIAVWLPSEPQPAADVTLTANEVAALDRALLAQNEQVWPPADPLDAVRAAIRALGDDDLARMVEVIDGGYSTLHNTLRNWAKGEKK